MHVRRAGQLVTRPLNCGVRLHVITHRDTQVSMSPAASNSVPWWRWPFRIGKVVFASYAAAFATLIVGLGVSLVLGWEPWFGQMWQDYFLLILTGLMVCWAPVMWRCLK
jgi:hypothetical protein